MSTLQTISPTVPVQDWLIPNLLPACELVLLDGDNAVGKTLLTAGLAAQLPGNILYANTRHQNQLLVHHLAQQNPQYDHLRHLSLEDLSTEGDVLSTLIPFLEEQLQAFKPVLLVLDGLEQFLHARLVGKRQPGVIQYEIFWRALRDLAQDNACTILVPRADGVHQTRSYGPFTRAGLRSATFALSLLWHPRDLNSRIITIVKQQRSLAGIQFRMTIQPAGLVQFQELARQCSIQPSKQLPLFTRAAVHDVDPFRPPETTPQSSSVVVRPFTKTPENQANAARTPLGKPSSIRVTPHVSRKPEDMKLVT